MENFKNLPGSDYFNRRSFHPSEIGGGPRYLTGEELNAFRRYIAGGFLTDRQSHLVQVINDQRNDPSLPWLEDLQGSGLSVDVLVNQSGSVTVNVDVQSSGKPVSVRVNSESTGIVQAETDRELSYAVGYIVVGVVSLFALRFLSDFWGWVLDELPLSLLLFVPIPSAILWILFRNRDNRSPYV